MIKSIETNSGRTANQENSGTVEVGEEVGLLMEILKYTVLTHEVELINFG